MTSLPTYSTLELSLDEGVLIITFNRPKRKNAFNGDQYGQLVEAFEFAKSNEDVKVVVNELNSNSLEVLTGKGDYYSSGNDLAVFMSVDLSEKDQLEKMLQEAKRVLFISSSSHQSNCKASFLRLFNSQRF